MYLLSIWILLGACASVIVVKGLLEIRRRDTHLLRERLTALETLHETTADVVLAVPLDLLRCLTVKNKTDGELGWQA